MENIKYDILLFQKLTPGQQFDTRKAETLISKSIIDMDLFNKGLKTMTSELL